MNGSCGERIGLTGLVEPARAGDFGGGVGEVCRCCTAFSGASFINGLGSNASSIRLAVFIERESDGGGTGVTGSDGSGKVLERFLGKDRTGAGLIGNALGGEVGSRFGVRGRKPMGPVILTSGLGGFGFTSLRWDVAVGVRELLVLLSETVEGEVGTGSILDFDNTRL